MLERNGKSKSMKKYKDFKEYIEENYLDMIMKRLEPYIISHRDDLEDEDFYSIKWVEEINASSVCGVTFKDLGNNWLEIRTSVDVDISFNGKTKYGYDSDSTTRTYNVFLKAILENGLCNVSVTDVAAYDKNVCDRNKSLSQNLVPYMYEEDVEKHAEDFLKRHYSKALLQPMPLPIDEIVKEMKMEFYYAPLEDGIFGKTYFGEEKVKVYTDITGSEEAEIITSPGTMLINPNVYFMYNVGTANNTIIHECVHWDRHRRPFELQRLLEGDCSHISCEIVEKYEGIPEDASAFKWMEWQANQLAPRILMPAEMTKRKLSDFLQARYQANPRERFAVHMEGANNDLSLFFGVSNIAAKLRAIELGFDQAQGVQVYCEGKCLPPFAFMKGVLTKDTTFVIDENNLLFNLVFRPELGRLYAEGKIVYANCMLCLNTPKYIILSESGEPILTDYALEHVDECCYIFKRKYSASDTYSDTFYRRCFLCRDIDAGAFIEANYDEENKSNQSKSERESELSKITDFAADMAEFMENLPGAFSKTLKAHMDRKGVNEEELSYRCHISVQTISKYINHNDEKKKYENVLAVGKALCLHPMYMEDLIKKAGFETDKADRASIIVKFLIWHHFDDTVEEWQKKLDEARTNINLPQEKNK